VRHHGFSHSSLYKVTSKQAPRNLLIELLIQPGVRRGVLRQLSRVGIDEEIGIDEDHRKASPSAKANTSAISSRFPTRQRPRETGSV
jgi:hypothetical protein